MSPAAWAVALALAAVAGFVGGAKWVRADWNAERAEQRAVALEAERMARAAESRRAAGSQEAMDAYAKKLRAAVAGAAAARSELDRLRDSLAAAPGGVPKDPGAAEHADETARARFVVGQCAATALGVAEAADACQAQLTALQQYVLGACK